MGMVPEAVHYIIFILCMLVSPIQDSPVYVDGINLSGGKIETLIISEPDRSVFHFEAVEPTGNKASLFVVKKMPDDVYQVILPDNSEIFVDLTKYISPDDLEKLKSRSAQENLAIDINGMGRVEVNESGVVTYLKAIIKSRPMILAIHN